ncbi:MAG: hypothetical protein AAF633_00210 [Chloroflexota bacterium]
MNIESQENQRLFEENNLLKQRIAFLDGQISKLAKQVQELQFALFKEKHGFVHSFGDPIKIDPHIREYAQSNFANGLNPLMFSGEEGVIIGFNELAEEIYIGSHLQDPAPIPVPVGLITSVL